MQCHCFLAASGPRLFEIAAIRLSGINSNLTFSVVCYVKMTPFKHVRLPDWDQCLSLSNITRCLEQYSSNPIKVYFIPHIRTILFHELMTTYILIRLKRMVPAWTRVLHLFTAFSISENEFTIPSIAQLSCKFRCTRTLARRIASDVLGTNYLRAVHVSRKVQQSSALLPS